MKNIFDILMELEDNFDSYGGKAPIESDVLLLKEVVQQLNPVYIELITAGGSGECVVELNYNSIVSIEVLNGVIEVWDHNDNVTTFNNCDESFWTFIDKIKL